MLYIVIAALFSVSVSIALKLYKQKNLDIYQILTFNYVSASILAYLWLQPDFSSLNLHSPWWLIIVLGILLPGVFWCLDRSLQDAGLMKTEIAQRISVVLTILISALIYQEYFSILKITGIILGVIAVIFMLIGQKNTVETKTTIPVSLISVWIGYAVIDLLFKYTASLGLKFSASLTAIFMLSTILMLIFNILRRCKWHWHNVIAGLLLGLFNFANIALYLQAHQQLKDNPSVVFAGMNILVVVFGMLAAIFIFKEKVTTNKLCGAVCAIIAVYVLMQSMI
ncbi:DMT family transporter [Acinetobacter qingfengensis]|uniref:EamA domain-containing protein n=1 Tax=Acinetobacter qingfengensis TaxID=1262585 RepID=A0A1E7R6I0_9GAMM|nr:DMT family transporter [Acinetobacter qingfengensis]KAA8734681.1 DMT family transporter [Acinetobacter qingfengensis]OEY94950.1 hypothetical protein BJI46_13165 [Acinetobacter qingfengensis]